MKDKMELKQSILTLMEIYHQERSVQTETYVILSQVIVNDKRKYVRYAMVSVRRNSIRGKKMYLHIDAALVEKHQKLKEYNLT